MADSPAKRMREAKKRLQRERKAERKRLRQEEVKTGPEQTLSASDILPDLPSSGSPQNP